MCISDDWFYQSICSCILSPQTHCQKFTPKITTIHPPFQNPGSAPGLGLDRQPSLKTCYQVADTTLPEMIAGCHGDEEPEVYAGKTAFVSMQAFLQTLTAENLV